jgi:4-carboxymuconolactone decarboxylase
MQPDEALVYRLAMEMYETHRISDATYAEAQQVLGMEQLVVLVATMGYYCMVSMTLNTFQVPLPPGEPSPFQD